MTLTSTPGFNAGSAATSQADSGPSLREIAHCISSVWGSVLSPERWEILPVEDTFSNVLTLCTDAWAIS